jgi:hypothetical protein
MKKTFLICTMMFLAIGPAKGTPIVTAIPFPANEEGVTADLFDVAQGTVVTASSSLFPGFDARSALGFINASAIEPTRTIFRDVPIAIDFIDFQTVQPIDLGQYVLTLGANTAVPGENRWAKAFRLYGSSSPDDVQTHLLSSVTLDGPYVATYGSDQLQISDIVNATNVQYFRMEIERGAVTGFNGPRVIELDGFAVPEPSSVFLLAIGGLGMFGILARRVS